MSQLPNGKLSVKQAPSKNTICNATNLIAYICGCSKKIAGELMDNLPGTLNYPIYKHQGEI